MVVFVVVLPIRCSGCCLILLVLFFYYYFIIFVLVVFSYKNSCSCICCWSTVIVTIILTLLPALAANHIALAHLLAYSSLNFSFLLCLILSPPASCSLGVYVNAIINFVAVCSYTLWFNVICTYYCCFISILLLLLLL